MRKGFLWTFCTTLAVAGAAHAQSFPWYPPAAAQPQAFAPVSPYAMPGTPLTGSIGLPLGAPNAVTQALQSMPAPALRPALPAPAVRRVGAAVDGSTGALVVLEADRMPSGGAPEAKSTKTDVHAEAPCVLDGDDGDCGTYNVWQKGRFYASGEYLLWWIKDSRAVVPRRRNGRAIGGLAFRALAAAQQVSYQTGLWWGERS